MNSHNTELWKYLESHCSSEGFTLYDVDNYTKGKLRIYIDKPKAVESSEGEDSKPKKGSGVTSEDCSSLCRKLLHGLAVHGGALGVGSEPELEVSSPGLNRHLRLPVHFLGALGEQVKVTSRDGFHSGILVKASDSAVVIKSGETENEIFFPDIKKAQVDF